MVNAIESAGRPVKGGPLFCAQRNSTLTLRVSVLCASALWALTIATPASSANPNHDYSCATATGARHEPVQIQRVSDGDTVVLDDGRKVRIIGVNAPELSKKSEKALYAEADAAGELIKLIMAESKEVSLVLGDDAADRYGRVLAHLFFDQDRSVAGELLTRGLAAATAVSPNTRCAEHNQRLERVAREQKRGVWQYANNPWFGKNAKAPSIKGFHILTAVATDVRKRKKNWEIRLSNGVVVRAKTALLSDNEALNLTNKTLEVRGWFGHYNGTTSVRLHHRTNLSVRP